MQGRGKTKKRMLIFLSMALVALMCFGCKGSTKVQDTTGATEATPTPIPTQTPVPDVPEVEIRSPEDGARISDATITIVATANSDVGIDRVEFFVNEELLGTDTSAEYSFSWNLSQTKNGAYLLKAVAYDRLGRSATSELVSIEILQAPIREQWAVSANVRSIAVGDLDGDGRLLDLVVGHDLQSPTVTVFHQVTPRFFSNPTVITNTLPNSALLAMGPFDGDDHDDLASIGHYEDYLDRLAVSLGNGNGTFLDPDPIYPLLQDTYPFQLLAARFCGVTQPLGLATVANGYDTIFIHEGDGLGAFDLVDLVTTPYLPTGLGVGFFNNDEDLDLAVAFVGDPDPGISLHFGDGLGNFPDATPEHTMEGIEAYTVNVGNLRQSSDRDDFVGVGENSFTVFFNDGDGHFSDRETFESQDRLGLAGIGDFNSDGHKDIVVFSGDQPGESDLNLYLGNGEGFFELVAQWNVQSSHWNSDLKVADLDGDGTDDVVLTTSNPSALTVLWGR